MTEKIIQHLVFPHKGMQKKTILRVLCCMAMLLPVSCIQSGDVLIHKARQNASDIFISQMKDGGRAGRIRQIGVFSIEEDHANGSMRETLHNALIQQTNLDIVGMDEMAEKEKILETAGKILKYQRSYNADTLITMGEMTGLACMITGRIISTGHGLRSADIHFQGQVLDLEKGTILWAGPVDGRYYEPVGKIEAGVDVLILLVILCLVIWASNTEFFWGKDYAESHRRHIMQGIVGLVTISGFVLYYLVLA